MNDVKVERWRESWAGNAPLSKGGIEVMRPNIKAVGSLDRFSNFWIADSVRFSSLSLADFDWLCAGCYTVLVDLDEDLLLAAGHSQSQLDLGAEVMGLDVSKLSYFPGPAANADAALEIAEIVADFDIA
jgi:hypothetical protein